MHELKRLSDRHKAIIELCLQGHPRSDIARLSGLTPQAITIITNSPKFQDELARRRDRVESKIDEVHALSTSEAKEILQQSSVEAARTHVELLSSQDERVKQKSASEILDRVGLGRETSDRGGSQVVLDADTINVLQIALKEA